MQVSSSAIRRRAAMGRPIRYLVPDAVANYIDANGLYGAGAVAAESSSTPDAERASA